MTKLILILALVVCCGCAMTLCCESFFNNEIGERTMCWMCKEVTNEQSR